VISNAALQAPGPRTPPGARVGAAAVLTVTAVTGGRDV